ncbi:adrenodoxin [Cloeon dipterum]|uniref:adrenodoxin n=1 Tax=Cloeon dipterum TaxID=197152 RepID=UPI0032206710
MALFVKSLCRAAVRPQLAALLRSTSSTPPPACRFLSTSARLMSQEETISVTFIRADGKKISAKGKEGDSLLDVVVNKEVDLDGFGACEGTLTCSTCHVILSKEVYESLARPTDEELDMLDLAFDLTDTSRLGCQITLTKELDGLEVKVPASVNDARQ